MGKVTDRSDRRVYSYICQGCGLAMKYEEMVETVGKNSYGGEVVTKHCPVCGGEPCYDIEGVQAAQATARRPIAIDRDELMLAIQSACERATWEVLRGWWGIAPTNQAAEELAAPVYLAVEPAARKIVDNLRERGIAQVYRNGKVEEERA